MKNFETPFLFICEIVINYKVLRYRGFKQIKKGWKNSRNGHFTESFGTKDKFTFKFLLAESYSFTCSPWTRFFMSGLLDWQRIPSMDMTMTRGAESYSCTCSPWTRSSMSGLLYQQRIPAMDMTMTRGAESYIAVPVVTRPGPPCPDCWTGRGSQPWT